MTGTAGLQDVSRETRETLENFEELVSKWTARINLVSASTRGEIATRHIADSAQLFRYLPERGTILDIGSGGGFPGIVLAILARESCPDLHFTLVESDARKCAFLRTAKREFDLSVTVENKRIEALKRQGANVLTARALASLPALLGYAEMHLAEDGISLFMKGEGAEAEIEAARREFSFDLERAASMTNPQASILKITRICRV